MDLPYWFRRKKVEETVPLEAYEKQIRKRPVEIIENADKNVEQIYVKFPGMNLIDVSQSNEENSTGVKKQLLKRLMEKYDIKKYSSLHTHMGDEPGSVYPSRKDISKFLLRENEQTMYIAQRNKETGKVEGYLCISKKRSFTGKPDSEKLDRDIDIYDIERGHNEFKSGLNLLAKKYNLKIKYLPEENFAISSFLDEGKFVDKDNLERKLKKIYPLIATLGFLCGLFFLSTNITGNAIANLTNKTTSFLGTGLLIIGLIVGFFWLRGRNR